MAKRIIEGVARYVSIPAGGKGLDIGCGSGALAIAVAKNNSDAEVIGIDRWGREHASFSRALCENNVKAEGVLNISFIQVNALNLTSMMSTLTLFLAITFTATSQVLTDKNFFLKHYSH
jgi:methyltransferase type 11